MGHLTINVTANCQQNAPVKVKKSVNIWRRYGHKFAAQFWPQYKTSSTRSAALSARSVHNALYSSI